MPQLGSSKRFEQITVRVTYTATEKGTITVKGTVV